MTMPRFEVSLPVGKCLTPPGLCKRWNMTVSVKTLSRWREKQEGPPFIRLGRRILYPVDQLLAYEEVNGLSRKEE